MSQEPPAAPTELEEGTRCEWCGAEYVAAGRAQAATPTTRTRAPVSGDEPATHCEWCGAEYPLPEPPTRSTTAD